MRYWLIILIFLLPIRGLAQDAKATDVKQHAQKVEKDIDNNMVTMSNLVEALANNLGQLHYLRTLCYSDRDQKWRNKAAGLMNIEAPKPSARRKQLIRAFNNGYYMQKERYQACEPNVSIDVAALAENGRRLSLMLADPYREP